MNLTRLQILAALLLNIFFSSALGAEPGPSSYLITIDFTKTERTFAANPTGFCLSFLSDDDGGKGPNPFSDVLKSMRLGSLRYPMGTLAENYLFHDLSKGPPTEGKLQPRAMSVHPAPGSFQRAINPDGSYRPEILDFDEFVTLYKQSHAEPIVLVSTYGYLLTGSKCDEEIVLKNAEEWVHYANITRKLGIKYWELGNEVDCKGPREMMPQEHYLDLYQKMAARMKAVDPSIHTGLGTSMFNNFGKDYAREALKRFPKLVDFIVVHEYKDAIKTYEQYLNCDKKLLQTPQRILNLIDTFAPPARRKTTEILVTEFSSACAGTKPSEVSLERRRNNILNALMTFEMLADGVSMDDRIRYLNFWVTHNPWVQPGRDSSDYANAFSDDNTVLPRGRAVEIMARFVQDRMVQTQCPQGPVRCWASVSKNYSSAAAWLVNRTGEAQTIRVKLVGAPQNSSWSTWSLAGANPDDTAPSWGAGEGISVVDNIVTLTLPPLSITVLHNLGATH